MDNIKFDFDDITLQPALITYINSRSECSVASESCAFDSVLFTAPMDSVVSTKNMDVFIENRINVCLPRGEKKSPNAYNHNAFISCGISDIEAAIEGKNNKLLNEDYVLIDIANGHMNRMCKAIESIKKIRPGITLMVGNIANPLTFKVLSDAGADYIRCGIGGGAGCFVAGTKVITSTGVKNIEDISEGEKVLTHKKTFEEVYNTISYVTDEDLISINDTISTKNHEYYVLHKKFADIVTDENIHEHAQFIPADNLNDNYLVIEETNETYKLSEIVSIENVKNTNAFVYDLSVCNNESYTANNKFVHNCTTSANVAIHYPMGSLIKECRELKDKYNLSAYIVADGGMQKFSDIIKAIALGADFVMCGSIFAKSFESAGEMYWKGIQIKNPYLQKFMYANKFKLQKKYRGMSTKEVQKKWGNTKLKTAEGVTRYFNVEYSLSSWVENFNDYLRSCMSYCDAKTIKEFREKTTILFISENSLNRFKK